MSSPVARDLWRFWVYPELATWDMVRYAANILYCTLEYTAVIEYTLRYAANILQNMRCITK